MNGLTAREGYALWAAHYEQETVVSHLENDTVDAFNVSTAGRALLDVGCGTARRLRSVNAAVAVGVDLSFDMVASARDTTALAVGDMRALPVAHGAFDVVWCRLAIGHVREIGPVYRELARACRSGGTVIVSDVAPEAIAAGHRRTFADAEGATRELEHFVHLGSEHDESAHGAGLEIVRRRVGRIGPTVRGHYERAGRLGMYGEQFDSPLVHALMFRKSGAAAR